MLFRSLITKGKVEEIKALCGPGGIDCVVFSADLKGSQKRNLEEDFGVKTLDRTQVILDIFARRASSLKRSCFAMAFCENSHSTSLFADPATDNPSLLWVIHPSANIEGDQCLPRGRHHCINSSPPP